MEKAAARRGMMKFGIRFFVQEYFLGFLSHFGWNKINGMGQKFFDSRSQFLTSSQSIGFGSLRAKAHILRL